MHLSSAQFRGLFLVLLSICVLSAYLFTPLAFSPVPWPDASAFALPGLDFWNLGPAGAFKLPVFKMSSIRAFVPSYERVCFQVMPGLTILLGLLIKLGGAKILGATFLTRLVSVVALLGICFPLVKRDKPLTYLWAIALVADPVMRWGILVVRTEVFVGGLWLLVLSEFYRAQKFEKNLDVRRIGAFLAFGAYFHFNAVTWVMPTIVGVVALNWGQARPVARVLQQCVWIGLWALALLSPWLLYALVNHADFVAQMTIQFARLDHGVGRSIHDFYTFFHALWPTTGSPTPLPKLMNLGKAIFWITACFGIVVSRKPTSIAASVGLLAAIGMYWNKPEPWFATLAHFAFWGMLWILVMESASRVRRALSMLMAIMAVIGIVASGLNARAMPHGYNWRNYREWINCVDQTLGRQLGHPLSHPSLRIWQPYAPDALVDLVTLPRSSAESLAYDVTRTPDVPLDGRELEIALLHDALVLSTERGITPTAAEAHLNYRGPLRLEDQARLNRADQVPYAGLVQPLVLRGWTLSVCQQGAFWATIAREPHMNSAGDGK